MKSKCANCSASKTSFVKLQKGSGLDIHKGLTKAFGNKTLPGQKYQGEMHILGYSYCGPGTKLGNRLLNMITKGIDKPINSIDSICMKHDLGLS